MSFLSKTTYSKNSAMNEQVPYVVYYLDENLDENLE